MYFNLKPIIIILVALSIYGCSGVQLSEWHFPYMMQVQQGKYVTNAEFQQLKIGMSKEQASFIIGTPLTQFMFDKNRWDIIYQDYKNNKLIKSYSLTLLFDKNDKIINIKKTGELFDK